MEEYADEQKNNSICFFGDRDMCGGYERLIYSMGSIDEIEAFMEEK